MEFKGCPSRNLEDRNADRKQTMEAQLMRDKDSIKNGARAICMILAKEYAYTLPTSENVHEAALKHNRLFFGG